MAVLIEGILDFQNNAPINIAFEQVASLPSASSNARRYVYYNGVPYYSNGTSWLPLGGGGSSSVQLPERTVYVSPSFNNNYPYFSTLENAHAASVNDDTIIVFTGYYYPPSGFDMSKRSWRFMPNTVVVCNNLGFAAYNGESIQGSCRFELGTGGGVFTVAGGFIGSRIFEADGVIEGILRLEAIGDVRVGEIENVRINANGLYPYIDDLLFIDANIIHHIEMESKDFKTMINTDCIGSIDMKLGDLTIEFKRQKGLMASDLNRIKAINATTNECRLKLIDGKLSEYWDDGTYTPIYISGNAKVELQHIWIENNHGACIYIDNNSRNEHKLKVDNCILRGNPAIDSTISGEDVFCFGSWGVIDVSTNINMVTEPLNVGAIW